MKRQFFVIGVALAALALLAGCGSTPVPATPVPPTPVPPTAAPATAIPGRTSGPTGIQVLFLERSGGLQGIAESWTVFSSGTIESSHGSTVVVAPGQVRSALDQLKNAGFFEFEDEYGTAGTCNDCITYRLTADYGGMTKTVTAVQGATDTPANVLQAMDIVNALVSGVGEN